MSLNAISVDVMTLLAANGFGTKGDDLMAMEWSDKRDGQTLILDTGGIASALKEQYEQPTFQVLTRGGKKDDANTSYQSSRAIYEFLIAQDTACGLMGFEPTGGPPELIGRDENDRMVYSCNYYTFRNPA